MVYHHLAKFDGHRYCSGTDKMLLGCHVIKQDQISKWSGDYNDRSPSRKASILPSLVALGTAVSEI